MMMRKQGQGMSKDMLRVHLVREQMDKQIEDWFIIPEVKVTGSEIDRKWNSLEVKATGSEPEVINQWKEDMVRLAMANRVVRESHQGHNRVLNLARVKFY